MVYIIFQPTPKSEVQTVLSEMAEQEIDEVDFIMDDINDELKDLQVRRIIIFAVKVVKFVQFN
jgi:hypothetical protein